ncbi:Rho termination factor N-terminal domain-containing protein [Kribbella sp. NPDC004875]|uniref:Rho termination factor N-terminal domain-containing protein n=1 Tax=Kribbella sp. NPDC004875 TaxID=3364107 RepID=UPI00369DFD99
MTSYDSIGTKLGDRLEEKVTDAYEQVKSGVQDLSANARGHRSGETKAELYAAAQRLGIRGRSKMTKAELSRAVHKARS